ncbi:Ger(x)C family spore germination protein [Evansella sp. LMS18]|uniref:Ger(x)C family spore germination protein n=1 Tax=Evansella sp. LMS18 TaxID=2924033 RepID=UPI0020D10BDB|nr:Ger(x)C family spore germination protein [Evansella sp. LMS18]UTR12687.1 Ger(x)C family spore germination protein [Evansella sp. LMS18]
MKLLLLCILLILTAGCWDQLRLNDVDLIYAMGIDKTEEGDYKATVSVPRSSGGQDSEHLTSDTFSTTGKTIRELRVNLDNTIGGLLDSSKIRAILVQKTLAEEDLYTILDSFYRDPRAPLASKILISEGTAEELFQAITGKPELISEYFVDLVQSAERDAIVPIVNLQNICPVMLDKGRDFHLPLISSLSPTGNNALITGSALFNGKKMAGQLNNKESIIANLLSDLVSNNEKIIMTTSLPDNGQSESHGYITYQIDEYKTKMHIVPREGIYETEVNLQLFLNVLEYPPDKLSEHNTVAKLNQDIEEDLQTVTDNTVKKLQESRTDLLGIRREIMAFHNDKFEEEEAVWKESFAEMAINVNVEVEIIHHGIIN